MVVRLQYLGVRLMRLMSDYLGGVRVSGGVYVRFLGGLVGLLRGWEV